MSATPNLIQLQGLAGVTGATGAATGNGVVINTMGGYGTLALEVSGTFSATVTFEGTIDGTSWFGVSLKPMTDAAAVPTTTTIGAFKLPTDVLIDKFRARVSAWTSGTVVVKAFVLSRNI
jgi:hypothetical protein